MQNVEGRNISISPDRHLQQLGDENQTTQEAGKLDTARQDSLATKTLTGHKFSYNKKQTPVHILTSQSS